MMRKTLGPSENIGWAYYVFGTAIVLLWVALWFNATFYSMAAIWARSATFTHGFFIFPISLWLIWRKREELSRICPKPQPLFLLVVALGGCIWLLGQFANANFIRQFSVVIVVISVIVSLLGLKVARSIFFPLVFLFFAVPAGEFLLPALMDATADFTVFALRLSDIPVHREGLQFVIPTGNWSVVEACSGIRYLIASITVGSLFAYLNFMSWRFRILFLCLAIIFPLFANWVRAYLIVLIGHLTNNRLATGVDHLIYGWIFFGLVIAVLFLIGSHWSKLESNSTQIHHSSMGAIKCALKEEGLSNATGRVLFFILTAVVAVIPVWISEL